MKRRSTLITARLDFFDSSTMYVGQTTRRDRQMTTTRTHTHSWKVQQL